MNKLKLKAKMVEKGFTQEQLADSIGMNTVTLNRKINEKRSFTFDEVKKIIKVLDLCFEEIKEIFFSET